jgi:polar amino acid transport system permease protein
MFAGLWITFQLVAISVAIGFVLAVGLAVARLYGPKWAQAAINGYTTFFRGTPLLCQLFLVYYGLGQFRLFWQDVGLWWFFREPFYCAVFTFTINTAAYQAEILRGAIQSIPRGQFEGALSLGLHRWATLRLVVMPQAMILALRPLGNELIVLIKASAITSLVTLFDLMGATRLAFARSFDLSIYLYAALIYLALVEVIRRVWDRLELRLTRHMALR